MLRVVTGSRSRTHEDGNLATLSSFQIHPLLLPSQVAPTPKSTLRSSKPIVVAMSSDPFSTFRQSVVSRSKVKDMNMTLCSGLTGGEAVFSVTLECEVTRFAKGGGRWPLAQVDYDGVGKKRNFTARDAVDIPRDEKGVRGVLRRLMKAVTPLQNLNLVGSQWEEILPEAQVPLLSSLAREVCRHGGILHVTIMLEVEQLIEFEASKILLATCAEAAPAHGCVDCSICLLEEAKPAVHVPCCSGTFHSNCLADWFERSSTCPLCRACLSRFLHPEVQIFFRQFY